MALKAYKVQMALKAIRARLVIKDPLVSKELMAFLGTKV
jgi:hypothetical protein